MAGSCSSVVASGQIVVTIVSGWISTFGVMDLIGGFSAHASWAIVSSWGDISIVESQCS